MRLAPAAALFLALALPAASAQAQAGKPPRRIITGVVVDSATGKPLAGAAVDLGKREVVTDSAGRFRLPDVAEGAVRLSAWQLGYGDRDVDLTVGEGMAPVQIALAPDPVKLKAITVMADRFKSRRNSVPYSVQAYDRNALLTSGEFNMRDFLEYHGAMMARDCVGGEPSLGGGPFHSSFGWNATGGGLCVLVRGRWVEPQVWIDERPAFSDELLNYAPGDIFLVEVYGRGRMIRAYTDWWVENGGKRPLEPIFF